jgi:outer membrane protein assembly factor BamD (BamD/ComL family)
MLWGDEASKLEDQPEHQAALQALASGLPEVAAVKWERLLHDASLTHEQADAIAMRMVEALVRARLPEKAIVALTLFQLPDEDFWLAQCRLLQGRLREAEILLRSYIKPGARYQEYAQMALGQVIGGQGRESTSRKEFRDLQSSSNPALSREARLLWNESEIVAGRSENVLKRLTTEERVDLRVSFLSACAYLENGDGKTAERILRKILEAKTPMPPRLRDACVLRLAEAYRLQVGRARKAEKLINKLLDQDEPIEFYETAFADLRELDDGDADLVTHLLSWAFQPKPAERQALALFHAAAVLRDRGHFTEAAGLVETFRTLFPDHPREGDALRMAMECYGAMQADDRVLELAKEWRNKFEAGSGGAVDYLTGMIRFSRKDFAQAMGLFEKAAQLSAELIPARRALYNMAVAAYFAGDKRAYEGCLVELQKKPDTENTDAPARKSSNTDDLAATLELEHARQLASKRDAGAEAALQTFIQSHGDHPLLVQAEVALAEFYLLNDTPLTKSAQTAVDACRAIKEVSQEWQERVDYTALWVKQAEADHPGVAKLGLAFLERWTKSARRDQVRMTVAQALYRSEEFAQAMAQFELLVEENAESPFAEAALFFAGKSSMAQINAEGLDHAIELWGEVAQRGGPLAREAQRQQALAKRREGKESDALAVIETLLTAKTPPTGEERLSLLVEKSELLMLIAKQEPKGLEDALGILRQIMQDAKAPRAWRSRAGVLLEQCLERMGKVSEALEVCHDVVESSLSGNSIATTPTDFLWLYRAGFSALRILEEHKQWEAAAKLADRLAKTNGDQAEEAKKHATRILTEHFIWDK